MKKIITAILAVSLSTVSFFTAEAQRRSSGENRGRMNRSPRTVKMNDSMKKEWAELQTELAKKDPEGFKEVKKLAETNLPAAYNKMQLLIQKAGLKAPRPRFSRNNMPRREGMRGREGFGGRPFGGNRGGMMNMPNPGQKRAEAEAGIAQKFPQEYAAVKKSEEENRAKLRDLAVKSGIKLPANAEEMAYVAKKYEKELERLSRQERFAKMRECLEKEGYEFSFGPFGGFRGGTAAVKPAPPAKRDFSRNDLARKAKQQYPEEWQEYVELTRKDKKAAAEKLETLLKKVK